MALAELTCLNLFSLIMNEVLPDFWYSKHSDILAGFLPLLAFAQAHFHFLEDWEHTHGLSFLFILLVLLLSV